MVDLRATVVSARPKSVNTNRCNPCGVLTSRQSTRQRLASLHIDASGNILSASQTSPLTINGSSSFPPCQQESGTPSH